MPNDEHRRAQELAVRAGLERDKRAEEAAHDLYLRAANLERKALAKIPEEKVRTRGILAVSLASMLYKARDYEQAEVELYKLLAMEGLPAASRHQLRELLEVVWDEKALLEDGYQYSEQDLQVSLRGGAIGSGTAPFDLVVQKETGFRSLLYRVAEWTGGHPIRRRGEPPSEIMDALQLRAAQPMAGSYRFTVRLVEPSQPPLPIAELETRTVSPSGITKATFEILGMLSSGDAARFRDYVASADYRQVFSRLARNITPKPKRDAHEVEVKRLSKGDQVQPIESVRLVPESRIAIKRILEETFDKEEAAREVRGVLRALHLDQEWVGITVDGETRKYATPPDFLDDVVGPMVNQPVIAYVRGRKRSRRLLRDIELDEEAGQEG